MAETSKPGIETNPLFLFFVWVLIASLASLILNICFHSMDVETNFLAILGIIFAMRLIVMINGGWNTPK